MKVGFIGLGTMGAKMAANVQKAGFSMVVHDARRAAAEPFLAKGAQWADTPADTGAQCDVVLSSLPGPPEVEAVAFAEKGLLAGMKPGSAWFDLSTNSPQIVTRINKEFKAKGVHALDAPVSGGPKGAETGKLALWVSGDEPSFNKYVSVLNALGDQVSYVGESGTATIAKLVHNCANYMIVVMESEVFSLGIKAGVEPLALFRAVRQGAVGRRRTFDNMIDQYLPGTYDKPNFALRLAHKDVALATALGRDLGLPMRLANLTLEEMSEAMARGWGARDSRAVMLLQQERAGIQVAVSPEEIKAALASG
jgi:3-hydroxyisobutyrate dehydrogenase-like beta-hydroxyacid dehydrogenase